MRRPTLVDSNERAYTLVGIGGQCMTFDEHARQLGGLVANFQSLEFALRAFLQGLPSAPPIGIPYGTDIYSFPAGHVLPENELTNYDSLGTLIRRFNAEMSVQGLPEIDSNLVEVRDALAHGRVSGLREDTNLRLLKFDKPRNGRVRVTFNEELTEVWFASQKRRVVEAVKHVAALIPPP